MYINLLILLAWNIKVEPLCQKSFKLAELIGDTLDASEQNSVMPQAGDELITNAIHLRLGMAERNLFWLCSGQANSNFITA